MATRTCCPLAAQGPMLSQVGRGCWLDRLCAVRHLSPTRLRGVVGWLARSSMGWLIAALALGWLGLRLPPPPLRPGRRRSGTLHMGPLPSGLPAPVDRFYRQTFGSWAPIVTSAELVGRGWLRLLGLRWPARFRFVHVAGKSFRSDIEVTLFGVPVLKVHESFEDGHGSMRTPFGEQPSDSRLDQGSELRLWAETVAWLPTVLVTDWRLRWSPVADAIALLHVPTATGTETFVVRFDAETGAPCLLECMRYRGREEQKTLWLCALRDWRPVSGQTVAETGVLTWADQGKPWASFTVEEVVYNADDEERRAGS